MKLTYVTKAWFLGVSSFLLFACGNNDQEETEPNETTEEITETYDANDNAEDSVGNGTEDAETSGENENNKANDDAEDSEIHEQQNYLSELVSMNDEEREQHHRSLAIEGTELVDHVFDNLLLPGIHENTQFYEGRVNPEARVRIEFTESIEMNDRETVNPEVSEEGYFEVDLHDYEFYEGDGIIVRLTEDGYPREQIFSIPVYETQDGMEEVRVRE